MAVSQRGNRINRLEEIMRVIIILLAVIWAIQFLGLLAYPNLLDGYSGGVATIAKVWLYGPLVALGAWVAYRCFIGVFK